MSAPLLLLFSAAAAFALYSLFWWRRGPGPIRGGQNLEIVEVAPQEAGDVLPPHLVLIALNFSQAIDQMLISKVLI